MRFTKILLVCLGSVLLAGLAANPFAGAANVGNPLLTTILADGGAPPPIPPVMADGGAPPPIPPVMADGGAPPPIPPVMADGGAPPPIPPTASVDFGIAA
jgi:hypothetical protein